MIVLRLADLEPTVGKLTERRLDQGSNVSYRPKRFVAAGDIRPQRNPNDRCAGSVALTERGQALHAEAGEILADAAVLTDVSAFEAEPSWCVLLRERFRGPLRPTRRPGD